MWGPTIQYNFQLAISNGRSINVLRDLWLSCIPIDQWPTFINVNASLENVKVCDLITPLKEWDLSLISTIISTEMTTKLDMLSIIYSDVTDLLIWGISVSNNLKI